MRTITVEYDIHLARHGKAKTIQPGPSPATHESGRVPRITRFLALAIQAEQLLRDGTITKYADLTELGHMTRALITQIMNLLHLAPDIQEAILDLPRTTTGRDAIIPARPATAHDDPGLAETTQDVARVGQPK